MKRYTTTTETTTTEVACTRIHFDNDNTTGYLDYAMHGETAVILCYSIESKPDTNLPNWEVMSILRHKTGISSIILLDKANIWE